MTWIQPDALGAELPVSGWAAAGPFRAGGAGGGEAELLCTLHSRGVPGAGGRGTSPAALPGSTE